MAVVDRHDESDSKGETMMNQWVERYIYAVSKKLPVSMREDVSKELRANIQDMIADDPLKEEDISDKFPVPIS